MIKLDDNTALAGCDGLGRADKQARADMFPRPGRVGARQFVGRYRVKQSAPMQAAAGMLMSAEDWGQLRTPELFARALCYS